MLSSSAARLRFHLVCSRARLIASISVAARRLRKVTFGADGSESVEAGAINGCSALFFGSFIVSMSLMFAKVVIHQFVLPVKKDRFARAIGIFVVASWTKTAWPFSREMLPSLSGFQVVALQTYAQGTLNQVDGNHETPFAVLFHQDPFSPVQGTSANPYSLAYFQVRMAHERKFAVHNGLDIFDLLFGDWGTLTAIAYEARHTFSLKYSEPFFRIAHQAHKRVPWEKRKLHYLLPIAPPA